MPHFPTGTKSPFARAVAAEVRARMAAERITLREFASRAGFASHNYVAIRLRDEKPFNLDDVDLIADFFQEDAPQLLQAAYDHHDERLWAQALELERAHDADTLEAHARANYAVTEHVLYVGQASKEDDEASQAVKRLDQHARDTRPTRKQQMQEIEDQAARDEG